MRDSTERTGLQDFTPVYHPAGFDPELRAVLADLQLGRWLAVRDLLARTGGNWMLRTSRTQVLAAAAARTDAVEAWLVEEPESADAVVMRARVAVERALQAHRGEHTTAALLEQEARHACLVAARQIPVDPVPWVGLLALAQVDTDLRCPEHWRVAWEDMLPAGPWGLLARVGERDPGGNREAHHRVLQFFYACPHTSVADAINFAQWTVSWAPVGSPLRMLPLYAYMESYWRHRQDGTADPLQHRQWSREPVVHYVRRAFQGWSERPAASTSVVDLNYLAHALWAGHQYEDAAKVFRALDRHATRLPWAYVCDDPGRPEAAVREFVRARAQCLTTSRTRAAPAAKHRLRLI
ncbi:hypothetical protein [Streptomyces sp. CBMA152]|uniref:hypothetical protein n=1 Tax=Streptomyces sp. CBMA152 TaxID=1896312 RepID=UPI0016600A73|nr:hypothetical protein [Streptomyces sp. CBMA152]MBD0741895.1 hypothetical protein [Streptomyces sp. CBMA152]